MEDGSPVIFMKISTGSTENIKPELVLDAYYQHRGEERPAFAWMTCRREVYADLASEQKKEQGFTSLFPDGPGRNDCIMEKLIITRWRAAFLTALFSGGTALS